MKDNVNILAVDILDDSGKLKSNMAGFHTCVYPEFEIQANEKMSKYLSAWEIVKVSSAEFAMSISVKKNGKFLELEWRIFEYLSNHRINIHRKMKIPQEFSLENFGNERKSLQLAEDGFSLNFEVKKGTRRLRANLIEPNIGQCDLDITLMNGNTKSFASVNGFQDLENFLVVENRLAMQTSGFAKFGAMSFFFNTKKNSASLFYGRGILPQQIKVVQSITSGEINEKPFGLTIFNDGNTINACTFSYDGVLHNFKSVKVEIDYENPMNPWVISSYDRNFRITVSPFEENVAERKNLFKKVVGSVKKYNALIEGFCNVNDGGKVEFENLVAEFVITESI